MLRAVGQSEIKADDAAKKGKPAPPGVCELERWDTWARRALKGKVPVTDHSRAAQEEGQTRDESERGAYDFFATYQRLEWHPDFLNLEVIDDDDERQFVRFASAVWTMVFTYRDLRWNAPCRTLMVFEYDPEDKESMTLLLNQIKQAVCTLYGKNIIHFWGNAFLG